MTPEIIGFACIALLIALFVIGMPVAFAMCFVGLLGFTLLSGHEAAFALLRHDILDTFSSYTLSVIPMFILMGSFAYAAGISQRLYKSNYIWLGSFRGGLTLATVMACAGFAAICGSTSATAATMGKIALPEMKKYGYDDSMATGTVAAAGTLGIIIPPSTILIIYGILTEQSIGKLFLAGIIPGILLTLAFATTVVILCYLKPELGPSGPRTTLREKLGSITGIAEAMALFMLIIGGLFAGWFSPTQAGAIGAAGALAIGLIRRKISLSQFYLSCRDGLRTGVMILFIITGATVFGHFLAISNIPFSLAEWVSSLDVAPMVVILVIIIIYFLGGFFIDSMALVVITIPIFYPIVQQLQCDPIWFGVIVVLVAEMGVITPPVGVNVFVIKGIAPDVSLDKIFRGIWPFLIALMLVTLVIVIFPQIATYLPGYIRY